MIEITFSDQWHTTFPNAHIGYLIVKGVDNQKRPSSLDQHKIDVVTAVREKFAGQERADLIQHPILKAYRTYYKKFNKTYHVQLQLESILHKGRNLPNVNPLVDSAFAVEVETLVLTASHDIDKLNGPILFDATEKGEPFTQMGNREQTLKANDMVMRDRNQPACTIIYGQDNISPISPNTQNGIYVAYCPAGVPKSAIETHFEAIQQNILKFQPDAQFEPPQIVKGQGR